MTVAVEGYGGIAVDQLTNWLADESLTPPFCEPATRILLKQAFYVGSSRKQCWVELVVTGELSYPCRHQRDHWTKMTR